VTGAGSELAIHGGTPICPEELPAYPAMGDAELAAVERVIRSGRLSGFSGAWDDEFYGGSVVKQLEAEWQSRFRVKHAVSMNSATSCLIAAIGAARIGPGDEVIVPPFTMSATVVAPLFYGGIPVFADLSDDDFCLDSAAVREAITPRTKAILAVNLFGHPARLTELKALAREHGLVLIEDSSQAPLATENGRYAGTVGHIGVFSLNRHKHIHSGEGGMCVTDDDDLAQRLQLIRNHGENAVEALQIDDPTNLIGFNFRLSELSAAVALAQLQHVEEHVRRRVVAAERLTSELTGLEGITAPVVRPGCTHVYYMWPFRYAEDVVGVPRDVFSAALSAEGIPHNCGYLEPLYLLPVFQRRIAIGGAGFPFDLAPRDYSRGICPTAERLYEKELMLFEICAYDDAFDFADIFARGVRKVHGAREELARTHAQAHSLA
jgi:dTDP-4-amino-4,6-dideoxygalactose transaminase